MVFAYFDRVKETSSTTGTGSFTVTGAATGGFRTFGSVYSTSDTFDYCAVDQSGSNWETGIGTYSGTNTVARTTVQASSNAGSAVSFSGPTFVFVTETAASIVPKASGAKTANHIAIWDAAGRLADGGAIPTSILVNRKSSQIATRTAYTGVTAIPMDDTVPTSSEGVEWTTLSYTPANASNILTIRVNVYIGETSNTSDDLIATLLKDSDANAMATMKIDNDQDGNIVFTFIMTAGTTSAITFRSRISLGAGGSLEINGWLGGRKFGGSLVSTLEVEETTV